MKASTLLALGGLMATAGFSQHSLADPVACSGVDTMSLWSAAADGCQDQDKIFIWISNDATLDSLSTSFITFADNPVPGINTHTATFSNFPGAVGAFTGNLKYSIEIDLTLAPLDQFRDASLDTTVPGGGTGVTGRKTFYSDALFTNALDTITSTNGVPSAVTTAIEGFTKIWVDETWSQGNAGILTGSTNTWTERVTPVPVPGTLALFGLGLAALARRTRKA